MLVDGGITPSTWPASLSLTARASTPTDDPYYQLYMGIQATIPFALRNMGVQIALSSVVFTLYLILLCITSARHRQTWTFALATVVFALFFTTAFTKSLQLAHALQSPGHKVEMGIEFGDVVLTLCLPCIGDWFIWLRMLSLWPMDERKRPAYLIMFGIPVVIKVFRFAVLCFLLNLLYNQMATSIKAADLGSKVWPLQWPTWAEYGAMLVDVSICSAICVIRLTSLMSPTHSERRSLALQSRLRLLLSNTVSSFILPVLSAVVMIILGAVGSFDAYATTTKVNAGISDNPDDRTMGSEPSNQTNTFMQNKIRARSRSAGLSSGGRHPAAGGGIIQTTLEEAFVDHLDYGLQPYSPSGDFTTLGEKNGGSNEMVDGEDADDDDEDVEVGDGNGGSGGGEGRSRSQMGGSNVPLPGGPMGRQRSVSQLSSSSRTNGSGGGGRVGNGTEGGALEAGLRTSNGGGTGGGGSHEDRLSPASPTATPRGGSRSRTGAVPDFQQAFATDPDVAFAHHHHHHHAANMLASGSSPGIPSSLLGADEATQDVLRTMPRLSRFGQ
ncbi:hypothetical protein V8E36_009908 [Tilletia maclaganii]